MHITKCLIAIFIYISYFLPVYAADDTALGKVKWSMTIENIINIGYINLTEEKKYINNEEYIDYICTGNCMNPFITMAFKYFKNELYEVQAIVKDYYLVKDSLTERFGSPIDDDKSTFLHKTTWQNEYTIAILVGPQMGYLTYKKRRTPNTSGF